MYWFLDEMSWKKKQLENLQYNLDNWDGLAHLTRRYTCKLVIQRKYSKELAEMNDVQENTVMFLILRIDSFYSNINDLPLKIAQYLQDRRQSAQIYF